MDDNDRPHRAGVVDECFEDSDLEPMKLPGQITDLTLIENLFDNLGKQEAAFSIFPSSLNVLSQV